jgi:hypothetical protein
MDAAFEEANHVYRSAEISECGRYRWWLRRSWKLSGVGLNGLPVQSKGVCCFVMLNPSTADGTQDDPTIRRCIGFARHWGYDTLSVRNLFAWRATNPKELLKCGSATGGDRGNEELLAACTADLLVAAWGTNVPFLRDQVVLSMFRHHFPQKEIYCLGKTKNGSPRHPLYVKADAPLILLNQSQRVAS